MDRIKTVGWAGAGMKLAFVAYYRAKKRIIWAILGDHWFYIMENKTEQDFINLGTVANLMTSRYNRKQHVIFSVSNQSLFIAKANQL